MDTFSPPFEPQNAAAPTPLPTEAIPNSAPMVSTPQPQTATQAPASKNAWQIVLILGLLLFLSGVVGYIFLWMNP